MPVGKSTRGGGRAKVFYNFISVFSTGIYKATFFIFCFWFPTPIWSFVFPVFFFLVAFFFGFVYGLGIVFGRRVDCVEYLG